jgi:hypothetical protein
MNGFIDLAFREVLCIIFKFARFTPLIAAPAARFSGRGFGAPKLTSQLLQAHTLSLDKRVIGITVLVWHCLLPLQSGTDSREWRMLSMESKTPRVPPRRNVGRVGC